MPDPESFGILVGRPPGEDWPEYHTVIGPPSVPPVSAR